jgi:hypothetical protein
MPLRKATKNSLSGAMTPTSAATIFLVTPIPPTLLKAFDPEKALPDVSPDNIRLAPARNPPPTTFFDYFPILMPFKTIYKLIKRLVVRRAVEENDEEGERSVWTGKKKHRPVVESIVPLEIAYVFQIRLRIHVD